MIVKCINNDGCPGPDLTLGKIYDVISDGPDGFKIKDDNRKIKTFFKNRFEVVKEEEEEKTMKVKCISNVFVEDYLTRGKVYEAKKTQNPDVYLIIDDSGMENTFWKSTLKVVEEKEDLNTLFELLENNKNPAEFYKLVIFRDKHGYIDNRIGNASVTFYSISDGIEKAKEFLKKLEKEEPKNCLVFRKKDNSVISNYPSTKKEAEYYINGCVYPSMFEIRELK
jgi:hypothetical protein